MTELLVYHHLLILEVLVKRIFDADLPIAQNFSRTLPSFLDFL